MSKFIERKPNFRWPALAYLPFSGLKKSYNKLECLKNEKPGFSVRQKETAFTLRNETSEDTEHRRKPRKVDDF